MKTIELFSGTKSFSSVMHRNKHETFTIDNDPSLSPDLLKDMMEIDTLPRVDMLWASPPCQGFSVAVIGRNWHRDYTPKTNSARQAVDLAVKTCMLIEASNPTWWFIENPRGMLRKMPFMSEFLARTGGVRHTVSYCQYGDTRQKPTDIWTNAWWWTPKPVCSPGASCHIASPRGSRTGTQGLKGAEERGRIPPQLFEEILTQMPIIDETQYDTRSTGTLSDGYQGAAR